MAQIRVVRTLIYEGPEDWVRSTINSEGRYVKGKKVLSKSTTSVPDAPPIEPWLRSPVVDMTITEYIAFEEEA
jgi:hypothetical protein